MAILVYRNDQQQGPYEMEQIEQALREGQLSTSLARQRQPSVIADVRSQKLLALHTYYV